MAAAVAMMWTGSVMAAAPKPARAPALAPVAQPASITQPAAGEGGPVVANVGPAAVRMEQLHKALIEANGLNILLNLVQLEIAKQNAVRANITVTPADIEREREQTVNKMFEQSNQKLTEKI